MTSRYARVWIVVALSIIALAPSKVSAQSARLECPSWILSPASAPVTLVLSGGGARGLAHIGVLRVLDSLGVRPTLVVGTSIGALVGALYASGLSGRQIDSLARVMPLAEIFRRYPPIAVLTSGDLRAPLSVFAPVIALGAAGRGLRLLSPIAREPQLNGMLNQLLLNGNTAAAGDFDRLPRRFRAVATDMRTRSAVVLAGGDLAQAVRASLAIPVVFAPVRVGARLLLDGGLSDNIPISIARAAGAQRLLAIDVGPSMIDSTEKPAPTSMLTYLVDEAFLQSPDSLRPQDLLLRPAIDAFGQLEFKASSVGPLIEAGYQAASAAFRDCPSPNSQTALQPAGSSQETTFIARRLRRLAEEALYESVWLHPRRAEPMSSVPAGDGSRAALTFAPVAMPIPSRVALGGVMYDGHEGLNAWIAALNLAVAQGRATLGTAMTASEWRQELLMTAEGTRHKPVPVAVSEKEREPFGQVALPDPRSNLPPWSNPPRWLPRPTASLTGSREIVRLYDRAGLEQGRPSSKDAIVLGGLTMTPMTWRLFAGPAAHFWRTESTSRDTIDADRAFGAMIRAVRLFAPPPSGPDVNTIPQIAVEAMWLDQYRRVDANLDLRFERGPFIIRPRAAAGWSDTPPLAALFALGGSDGFPGLRVGERRGDQFAFGAVALLQRIAGPIYARAEVGGGRTANARPRSPDLVAGIGSGWVSGAELGFTTDTPVGPFVIGYGIASNGRSVFKIRLGG